MPPLSKKEFAELARKMSGASEQDILNAAHRLEQERYAHPDELKRHAADEAAERAFSRGRPSLQEVAEKQAGDPVGEAFSTLRTQGAKAATAMADAIPASIKAGVAGALEGPIKNISRTARAGISVLGSTGAGTAKGLDAFIKGGDKWEVIRKLLKGTVEAIPQDISEQETPSHVMKRHGVELSPTASFVTDAVVDVGNLIPLPKGPRVAARALDEVAETGAKAARTLPRQLALPELAAPAAKPLSPIPTPNAGRTATGPWALPTSFGTQKELYHLGEKGKDWYVQTLPKLQQLFGDEADALIKYFAATSPNASVAAKAKFAVKALEQARTGEPFSGFMGQSIERLKKAQKGEEFGGLKVRDFTNALFGDEDAVVVDRWIARAYGLEKLTAKQYGQIAQHVRALAKQLGVTPRQAQAAIWAGAKKKFGREGDTGAPFEDVLQELVGQRQLFNPEGLSNKFSKAELKGVEPALFTGPNYQRFVSDIQAAHAEGGGSTYNLHKGNLGGTEAYSVSIFPEREVVLPEGAKLGPKEIASFIQQNQDLLKDPRVSFGSWLVGPEDASVRYPAGSIVLGVSATPTHFGEARTLARSLGEEAIFDLKNFRTVRTGGKRTAELPPIEKRLEGLKGVAPQRLALEHRSKLEGLEELDPEKFGTGEPALERRRSLNYQGKFVPRSYFTRKGGEVEHQIAELPHTYEAEVGADRLYDIGSDPEGLLQEARSRAPGEWGDQSDNAALTLFERLIKDAGYAGMFNSKHSMPAMRDTVVLFEKMPVRRRTDTTPTPPLRKIS